LSDLHDFGIELSFPYIQLKKQLRQSQRDYERGTADHGVMVRELQTLISTERNKSETMEHQVNHFFSSIRIEFEWK
jgi:hypothetical protein